MRSSDLPDGGPTDDQDLPADGHTPSGRRAPDVDGAGSRNAPRVSVARSSTLLATATLVSRITGFLRTAAIVAAIGLGPVSSAYTVSLQIPNMVYELLLGGILSSVVVPLLVKAQAGPDGGKAYTDRLLSVALVLFGLVTALAVVAAPLITRIALGGDSPKAELTTTLSRLSLLTIAFLGMSALLGAVLNSRERFGATGWAPVINNLVVIVIAGVLIAITPRDALSLDRFGGWQLLLLGVTFPVGVAAQATALWMALRRSGYRWRWRADLRGAGLGEIGRLAKWTLFYVLVNQVAVFVLINVLSLNEKQGGPGNAVHGQAFVLFMLPHGIAAVSVITALLPRMSRLAAADDRRGVANQLNQGIRMSSVLLVLSTAAYVALGLPIATAIFGHRNAEPELVTAVGWATVAAGVGLVPFAWSQLQLFAFYAMRDTRTPALLNVAVIAIRIAAFILAYQVLPPSMLVVGTMTANTLSYVAALVLTGLVLRRRLGPLGTTSLLRTLSRLALAGTVAGLAGWLTGWAILSWQGSSAGPSTAAVLVGGTVLTVLFAAGAHALRVREVTEVVGMVRRRLTRHA